jgi:F-type H+-transporting ATPase subunit a
MAEEHGAGAEDLGSVIIHHISNGEPLAEIKVPLGPLGTLDLSISKHVVMLLISAAVVFVLFTWLAGRLKRSKSGAPRGTLTTMLEFFVSFIREQMVLPFIGPKYAATFTPLILTFFTFILTSNLIGMVPIFDWVPGAIRHGSSTATGNFNVTGGLALITFFAIIYAGTIAHGFIGHWKNIVPHGLAWPLYIILIPIEIISMFVKPVALTLRLAANMTAGHAAILASLSLIFIFKSVLVGFFASTPLVIGLMLLEIIVCFIQAYVFSLLSALFIGMAIHVSH